MYAFGERGRSPLVHVEHNVVFHEVSGDAANTSDERLNLRD